MNLILTKDWISQSNQQNPFTRILVLSTNTFLSSFQVKILKYGEDQGFAQSPLAGKQHDKTQPIFSDCKVLLFPLAHYSLETSGYAWVGLKRNSCLGWSTT